MNVITMQLRITADFLLMRGEQWHIANHSQHKKWYNTKGTSWSLTLPDLLPIHYDAEPINLFVTERQVDPPHSTCLTSGN